MFHIFLRKSKGTCAFTIAATETMMAMLETAMSKAPTMRVPDLRLVQPYILKAKYTNTNTNSQKLQIQIHKWGCLIIGLFIHNISSTHHILLSFRLLPFSLHKHKHSKLKNMKQARKVWAQQQQLRGRKSRCLSLSFSGKVGLGRLNYVAGK